jgi:hypothetical protein
MVKAFPELRVACGFCLCTWGKDQHWWCVAPDGTVVDPTKSQFHAVFGYEEVDPNDPATRNRVPSGVCMDCGDAVFNGNTFCCHECEDATRSYLTMTPLPRLGPLLSNGEYYQ